MRSILRTSSHASQETRVSTVSGLSKPPTGCDLATPPTVPSEGMPSAAWFERVLAAEREVLAHFVAERHQVLLADLQASLTEEAVAQALGLKGEAQQAEPFEESATQVREFERESFDASHATTPDTSAGNGETQISLPTSAGCKVAWEDVAPGPGFVETDEDVKPQSGRALAGPDIAGINSRRLSELKEEMGGGGQTEEQGAGNFFSKLVEDSRFELTVAILIMCNAVVMSFEMQYAGIGLGNDLGYGRYSRTSEETWPGGKLGFDVMDYIFGIIFTLELFIKVLGQRCNWLRDAWNYLDAVIVVLWLIEKPFNDALPLPIDATILRTARLFRLLRVLKLLRTLHGLDALYLMLTSLKGCFYVLGWSVVLLLVTQMLIAMLFVFILNETYFKNDDFPQQERREVFEYFGTWSRAMLSMFEMTLANWPPVCRLLAENVSEWFSVFCIFHKLTMGFAVIGVINGVFMQETFKVAATDDKIMLRQKEREVKVHTAKMKRLFRAADESGDGLIDVGEFKQVMEDKEILFWLSSMEIPVRDPEVLYKMLDRDGDEQLTCEELVKGAMALRGAAKSVDVLEIKAQLGAINRALRLDGFKVQKRLY